MSFREADQLQYYLSMQPEITSIKVRERTQDASICYTGDRERIIELLRSFRYEAVVVPDAYLQNSGRELNENYKEKLICHVVLRLGNNLFLPYPVRVGITVLKSIKYLWHGVRTLAARKLEVPVLDATAIGVSLLRGDFDTASSVMFLLRIGEILEEWTHKK
jgi:cation transport ATPase